MRLMCCLLHSSRHLQLTDDIREYLRQPTFDNWQWEDAEMMLLLQQMYLDLDFMAKFNIEVSSFYPFPKVLLHETVPQYAK